MSRWLVLRGTPHENRRLCRLSSEVRVGLCSGVSMSEDGAFGSAEEPLG